MPTPQEHSDYPAAVYTSHPSHSQTPDVIVAAAAGTAAASGSLVPVPSWAIVDTAAARVANSADTARVVVGIGYFADIAVADSLDTAPTIAVVRRRLAWGNSCSSLQREEETWASVGN